MSFSIDFEALAELGWTPFFNAQFSELDEPLLTPPERVASAVRGELLLLGVAGQRRATLAGRLTHEHPDRLPLVGDWVLAEPAPPAPGRIMHVFERATLLRRKDPGLTSRAQGIVANADTALIVAAFGGADADPHARSHALNPRRLERYVTLAIGARLSPLVVLNKSDLAEDAEERAAELGARLGVAVLPVSARRGDGVERLFAQLPAPQTAILLGSSGVGKSSLTNRLLGSDVQRVLEVRENDARGRHTTTARELFRLPNGSFLIDTPGMRELGLVASEEPDWASPGFAEIEVLSAGCRFRDCRHRDEPGCAVLAAVERGELDQARVEHAHKLEREATRQRELGDAFLRHQANQRRRAFSRHVRATMRKKGGT